MIKLIIALLIMLFDFVKKVFMGIRMDGMDTFHKKPKEWNGLKRSESKMPAACGLARGSPGSSLVYAYG